MTAASSDALARLLAKDRITEALHAYARGADRIDLDLIRSVFHPDAVADYGSMFQGTGYGFADFIGQVHPPMSTHTHHLSNISIRVDGDRAGSECYVLMRARIVAEDGTVQHLASSGRYVDEWERRDGVWRIVHRRYLHSQDEVWTAETELFGAAGTRDRTDPSYEVLAHPAGTPEVAR
ncbi:nuclear transport factor 2 family protein [Nocardioides sp. YIM 152588]|uniref:nuclear transport factor 2 family protein n=1 Tax=Nocardioides sp. YIM 152588 TaxID=3158259 RepID=UPI0032E4B233